MATFPRLGGALANYEFVVLTHLLMLLPSTALTCGHVVGEVAGRLESKALLLLPRQLRLSIITSALLVHESFLLLTQRHLVCGLTDKLVLILSVKGLNVILMLIGKLLIIIAVKRLGTLLRHWLSYRLLLHLCLLLLQAGWR